MTDAITADDFATSVGTDGWIIADGVASRTFRTGSFAAGVELIDAIGELADDADHHPDVDLRYPTVTVRLTSHDIGGLSRRDAELARRIGEVATELDIGS